MIALKKAMKSIEAKYKFPRMQTKLIDVEYIGGFNNINNMKFVTVGGDVVHKCGKSYSHHDFNEMVDALRKGIYESDIDLFPAYMTENSQKTSFNLVWMSPRQIKVAGDIYYFGLKLFYNFRQMNRIQPVLYREWCSNGSVVSVGKFEAVKIGHYKRDADFSIKLDGFIKNLNLAMMVVEYLNEIDAPDFNPVVFKDKDGKKRERIILDWMGTDILGSYDDKSTGEIYYLYKDKYKGKDGATMYAVWNALTEYSTHLHERSDNSRINHAQKIDDLIIKEAYKIWEEDDSVLGNQNEMVTVGERYA